MMSVRGLGALWLAAVMAMATASGASAQGPAAKAPAPAPTKAALPVLVGADEVTRITPATGFVDDAAMATADQLAYVIADGTTEAELHLLTLSTKQEVVVDLAPVTLAPTEIRRVAPTRVLVIGTQDDGRQVAGAFELVAKGKKPAGTVAWKSAAATHLTLITRDGKPRLAVHEITTNGALVRHQVQLLAIETGKRVGAQRTLELDGDKHAKLGLRVNHWSDGWTKATGIRTGEWTKKEDQQSPDTESTYDLVTGKFGPRVPITDLFEQRRRFQVLAEAAGPTDFVRWGLDNVSLQVWSGSKSRDLELDQPATTYDKKSLQGLVAADGSAWIALKVDPVNAEAVARQKADPEYLDIFRVGPGADTKAVRKARILAKGLRHRLGAAGDQFWLLERNQGFERGGKLLVLYRPR